FGLFPKKGTIAVGSDADIVVFDPNRDQTISVKTHHMNVDYSAYEGKTIKGAVDTVLSRGSIVIDQGEFKGRAGSGQFLKRGEGVAIYPHRKICIPHHDGTVKGMKDSIQAPHPSGRKCASCGLVNAHADETCRRCGHALATGPPA